MQETVPEDTSSDPDYFAGEAVLVEGEGGAQGENIEDAMKEEVATEVSRRNELVELATCSLPLSTGPSPRHSFQAPVHTTVPAQQTVGCTSHVKNPAIPAFWRYGIVVYLLVIFCILVACDVGSGVSAEYVLLNPDGTIFKQRSLFHVSIFTSVKKLWNTGSYPLAIFIVLTSISWPFVKLGLSLFSWVTPFTNVKRRERLLEVIDMLGKWSFVDIFVLLIIMVAFRSNLELGFGGMSTKLRLQNNFIQGQLFLLYLHVLSSQSFLRLSSFLAGACTDLWRPACCLFLEPTKSYSFTDAFNITMRTAQLKTL